MSKFKLGKVILLSHFLKNLLKKLIFFKINLLFIVFYNQYYINISFKPQEIKRHQVITAEVYKPWFESVD